MKRIATIYGYVMILLLGAVSPAFSDTPGVAPRTPAEVEGDMSVDTIAWITEIDLEKGFISMGDHSYNLLKNTKYFNRFNKQTNKSAFTDSMTVKFVEYQDNILALWEVYDPQQEYGPKKKTVDSAADSSGAEPVSPSDKSPDASEPSKIGGGLKKVNGVWTN